MIETQPRASLRKLILENTGQDVRRCRECAVCHKNWSEPVLRAVVHACTQGISLEAVIGELRREAHRRGLDGKEDL